LATWHGLAEEFTVTVVVVNPFPVHRIVLKRRVGRIALKLLLLKLTLVLVGAHLQVRIVTLVSVVGVLVDAVSPVYWVLWVIQLDGGFILQAIVIHPLAMDRLVKTTFTLKRITAGHPLRLFLACTGNRCLEDYA
jgi:hypothetical protein